MKFKLFFLFLFNAFFINAQTVITSPSLPTVNDAITITFNANGTELQNFTGDVYAHTGLITSLSSTDSDWKFVISAWNVNTSKAKFTRDGSNPNLYNLQITPNIFGYYGAPTSETINKIALVVRSADSSKQTRPDIFIPIYSAGLNVTFTNPQPNATLELNQNINITAESTLNANLELFLNGTSIQTATNSKTINKYQTFSTAGNHTLKVTANDGITTKEQTINIYVKTPTQNATKPSGIKYGVTKNPDNSVTFLLKAPFKNDVFLIGDFNDWKLNSTYQLNKDGEDFWITINNLDINTEYAYQYFIDYSVKVSDPYSEKILDPWTDQFIKTGNYPNLKPYPTNKTTGYVSTFKINEEIYTWEVSNFTKPAQEKLVIYELFVRDFTESDSFKEVITKLDYLKNLGINAIELMPINEFEGADSWGYNPALYMALDKSYGTKNDFKKLVDECHKRGIAVLADVVFNHSYGQSPLLQMYFNSASNKPATNNPWYNEKSNFVDNGSAQWGYDFNHESAYTKTFFKDVLNYWMTEYKIDGFRFDFTKGMTNTLFYGSTNWGSAYDASRIAILKDYASHVWNHNTTNKPYVIFEHLSDNAEEKELADFGIMMWGNMNYSYSQNTMGFQTSADISYISHKARNWNNPNLVGYMESHDEERMMYRNINFGNSTTNPPYNVKDLKIALSRQELAGLFFLTVPGPKMIWQFGELGFDFSINTCVNGTISNDCRLARKPIKWDYFTDAKRKHVYSTWATLNAFRQQHPVFHTSDFTLNVSTLVKSIQLRHVTMDVVIIGNFDITNKSLNPNFTKTGTWYEYFSGEVRTVTNQTANIDLKPGEYRLYSTVKLADPLGGTVNDDSDGDGVNDAIDQCPNTLLGTPVNSTGCPIFSLPTNNFKLEVTQPTCVGINNGQLKITTTENHSYIATVNGVDYAFTNTTSIPNLSPKTYTVCIKIPAQNNYTQCFEFTIANPTGLSGRATIDTKSNKAVATVLIDSGTPPYTINLNGKVVEITTQNAVDINVNNGDLIEVKSSLACEGVIQKQINLLSDITVYPNPTSDFIEIFIPSHIKKESVKILLYNQLGKIVLTDDYNIYENRIKLSLENYAKGLYVMRILTEEPLTFNIIKQ
jgi:glycosidase